MPIQDMVWALGSLCALHRLPFSAELIIKQFPPPCERDTLIQAARALGFKAKAKLVRVDQIHRQVFPCLAWLQPSPPLAKAPSAQSSPDAPTACGVGETVHAPAAHIVFVTQSEPDKIVYFKPGKQTAIIQSTAQFDAHYTGHLMLVAPAAKSVADPDTPGKWGAAVRLPLVYS